MHRFPVAALGLLLAVVCFAAKPKKAPVQQDDPDERWACKLGSSHRCECARQVAEELEAHTEHCKATTTDTKTYEACMNSSPNECAIIAHTDLKHSAHSCKRTCSKARCRCLEEACFLPPLGNDGDTGVSQQ